MFHFADITWTQSLLIEIGVVLQVVAICAYVRDASPYRRLAHPKKKERDVDEQGWTSRTPDKAGKGQAGPTRDKSFGKETPGRIKPANLTRTSKVKFVQKFNFPRHGT